MAKVKTYGVFIRRKDYTRPQTDEEKKFFEKKKNPNDRFLTTFIVRVNSAIPYTHRMLEGGRLC